MNIDIENIFVQVPTYIFWKNLSSIYIGCNDASASLLGLTSPQEIIGKTDYDLCCHDFADCYQQGDRAVLDKENPYPKTETITKSNGETATIIINKKPLYDAQGQMMGVIGSYHESIDENYYGKFDPVKNNIALTKRELACLLQLVKGMTTKQIGAELDISRRTAEHHINSLKIKLNCPHKSLLIQKALSLNFIKLKISCDN